MMFRKIGRYSLSDNYVEKCSVILLGLALTPSPLPHSRERGEVVVETRNINYICGLLGQYNFLNVYRTNEFYLR
jgi:hypothetical protein